MSRSNSRIWAINKETSLALKAVAITLVLFGHLTPPFLPFHEYYLPVKRFISQAGVNIFMFLSGYGIYVVYITGDYSPRHFFVRRLLKIWPSYSISVGMYYIFQVFIFHQNVSPASLASHLVGMHVFFGFKNDILPVFHFISAITLTYILSSLALFITNKDHRSLILGAFFFLQSLFFFLSKGAVFFADYFSAFLIGLCWAEYIKKEKFSSRFLLIGSGQLLFLLTDLHKGAIFLVSICSLPFLLHCSRSLLLNRPVLKKAVLWIGSSSYLIYLGHNYFFWKWPQLLEMFNSNTTVGTIIILATIIWMIILFDIERRISEARRALLLTLTSR
ncbi:MAG: acyltransferase family protein [Desulfobulbaceae bacterium]|nr:acyltransferase family protein [Desulfobulbaceae bacterium]